MTKEERGVREMVLLRLKLAEEILDLTKRQREAIRSETWDVLEGTLSAKDRRIERFQEIEGTLRAHALSPGAAAGRGSLQDTLSRTESTLLAVQSIENECRGLLAQKVRETAGTLRRIRRARDAIKRLRPQGAGLPRFIDLHE